MTGFVTRQLETVDEAKALAYFLAKERKRHNKDIVQIDKDLVKIKEKWKIDIPDPDVEVWVEI